MKWTRLLFVRRANQIGFVTYATELHFKIKAVTIKQPLLHEIIGGCFFCFVTPLLQYPFHVISKKAAFAISVGLVGIFFFDLTKANEDTITQTYACQIRFSLMNRSKKPQRQYSGLQFAVRVYLQNCGNYFIQHQHHRQCLR